MRDILLALSTLIATAYSGTLTLLIKVKLCSIFDLRFI